MTRVMVLALVLALTSACVLHTSAGDFDCRVLAVVNAVPILGCAGPVRR